MTCPACGAENRGGVKFCEECGARLEPRQAPRALMVLSGLPPFQARVLAEARRIPFGDVASYADLARRIGHPRAARAVGNALAANPVPVIIPCHRIIRMDGTWGRYALGDTLKTRLLALERSTPGASATPRARRARMRP